MKTYTIDADNNITQFASATEADAEAEVNTERFCTASGLAKLAEKWPTARLVEIWNSLQDVAPVKKFTDRKTGVTRIWKAIQSQEELAAAQEPKAVPEVAEEPASQPQTEAAPVTSNEPTIPEEQQAQPETAAIQPQEPSVRPAESIAEPTTPSDEPVAAVSAQAADVAPTEPAAAKKASRPKKAPKPALKAKVAREGSKAEIILGMLRRSCGATLAELMKATSWQPHSVRGFISIAGKKEKIDSRKNAAGERVYSIA